jgi:hypothetical protein
MPTFLRDVPYLTTEQMIEVDRAMMEDFHIELVERTETVTQAGNVGLIIDGLIGYSLFLQFYRKDNVTPI